MHFKKMFSYLLKEAERNTQPEHERPDLIPDLSSESEMELQLVCHQLYLSLFTLSEAYSSDLIQFYCSVRKR